MKHYSDPIHHETTADNGDDEDELQSQLDSHDEGSSLPPLPAVCEFWYRKLLKAGDSEITMCNEKSDETISLAITRELLHCYETIIRPVLVDSADSVNSAVKVIEHYELLLAHFVKNAANDNVSSDTATSCGVDGVVKSLEKVHMSKSNNQDSDELLQLGNIIHCISQDISHWMSKTIPNNDARTKYKVFPYLLRLLGYCVTLLSSNGMIDLNNESDLTAFREALSIATVTCVPFVGDGKSKSGNFGIGTLLDWILESTNDGTNCSPISLAAALKCCSPSPYSVMDDSDLMSSPSFMQRTIVGWSSRSAHFVAP